MERENSVREGATSKKTLEDLEDEQPVPDQASNNLPSPDGALDDEDELKDADPE